MGSEPQSTLAEALTDPACYDHEVADVRVVETHISWVFLTGRFAYKVKKPIKLPFLDFSSAQRRKHFCDEELRLNKRLAPTLYLGVVPIGGTPDAPRIGREPAFEHAVKMRQFPHDARLDRELAAGHVTLDAVLGFAEDLARFHADLPPLSRQATGTAGPDAVAAALDNLQELESCLHDREQLDALAGIRDWTERTGKALAECFAQRLAGGAHRECHGDLHLENLLLQDGRVMAFDALEFEPKLREIDVINEMAFLVMDLLAHGHTAFAYRFLSRYLEVTGDYEGLAVLRFYLVERALIRAKVRALRASQTATSGDGPAPYLRLAAELAAPARPLLAIAHGFSASGKTHVTDELIGRLPAVRLRSDVERKRLHGLAADARTDSPVGGGLYSAEITAQTYARLAELGATGLGSEFNVIVDAAFLESALRHRFQTVAENAGATFRILDCTAPEAVLRDRIVERSAAGRDASEATAKVLDHQLAHAEPFDSDERDRVVTVYTNERIDYAALSRALAAR